MGCGSSRQAYREKDLQTYLAEQQLRYPSATYSAGKIELKTRDGFFNSSALLDGTWLQGKLSPQEYRQAIEHLNARVGQVCLGASKHLSIGQIPKTQSTLLAVEELNAKFAGRARFAYQSNGPEEASLLLSFD